MIAAPGRDPVAVAASRKAGRGCPKDVKAGDLLCVNSPWRSRRCARARCARPGPRRRRRARRRTRSCRGSARPGDASADDASAPFPTSRCSAGTSRGATSRSDPRRRRGPSPGTAPRWSRQRRSETPARWACARSPPLSTTGARPTRAVVIGHTVFLRAARGMREGGGETRCRAEPGRRLLRALQAAGRGGAERAEARRRRGCGARRGGEGDGGDAAVRYGCGGGRMKLAGNRRRAPQAPERAAAKNVGEFCERRDAERTTRESRFSNRARWAD